MNDVTIPTALVKVVSAREFNESKNRLTYERTYWIFRFFRLNVICYAEPLDCARALFLGVSP